MNHSFKFIVNPNNTENIEITSLLQYCALKNSLSELTSNNIKSLKYNEYPVFFSDAIKDVKPDASFTKYIQKKQSEKNAFKTKSLKDITAFSLFFNAISEIEYAGSFKGLRPWKYNNTAPDHYTVDDLYTIFMHYEYAKKYLLKYIPKNSEEVCYVQIPKTTTTNKGVDIRYDDSFINFDIIGSKYKDKEAKEEYVRLVNCINENVDFQILKNNGHLENTYDDLCVYTEDPDIIHKVLMNNQVIIDTMVNDIFYINYRLHEKYSHRSDVFNELQSSITNVVDTYETSKKKTEDNLLTLNGLFK